MTVQVVTSLVLLYTGWQFYRFVQHFETGGATPYVPRPTLVDGFLPITGLLGVKSWIVNGVFDTIHPAALVIFLTALTVSLLLQRGFCGWLCPVGLLSEVVGGIGKKVFGRNFKLPTPVDLALMAPKYLVLLFFVKVVVVDMSGPAAAEFLQSPYSKIVDVKMLYFFTEMSLGVGAFIGAVIVLSAVIGNFWCRYLCPYGALLGLVGILSPLKIRRNDESCIDCRLCTKVCPNRIDVAQTDRVESIECTGCMKCLSACPRKGALELKLAGMRREVNLWAYPALLIGVIAVFFLLAYATGHWYSSIGYEEYASLIPKAGSFSH